MIVGRFIAAILIGYLLGSIPFGLLVGRRTAKVDIRQYGSGKIGATNVLRTAGRKAAGLVVGLDIAKGALAVVIAGLLVNKSYLIVGNLGLGMLAAQVSAALAAIAGHIWPIFLKFHGGRGVATFFGGLVALCPVVALFGGEVLIVGAGLTRFASLGSLAGAVGTYAILVPLTILDGFPAEFLFYTLAGTLILLYMHRDNIARLMSGRERRLGEKGEALNSPSSTPPRNKK